MDSVVDEMGETTEYGYDSLGRLISVLDPLQNATGFEYDANGSRTRMTDAEGISTAYEYDGLNRLKAVVENYAAAQLPDFETNVRTEYVYDAGGNRLSILDGNSHAASFTYTAFGLVKTETDALGHTITHDYDALGSRVSLLDANETTTTYEYDELNRLKLINYPAPDADVAFDYDALGRRQSMNDGLGTTTWDYNTLDLPKSIADPFNANVSYDYDALGNRTQLTYPDSSILNYQYDALNRLQNVSGAGLSGNLIYGYEASGRLKSVTRPNGVDTAYNYFDNGWLKDITHSSASATLASYQYQYDPDGNRRQVIENIQSPVTGAQIDTFVAGAQQGSHLVDNNTSQRKSYAGVNNGPVKIHSTNNVPITASERVVYKVGGVDTSYSEMMGLPDNQLDTTFWFPWYNNTGLDTQLRFANVSTSTATVRVYIGGVEMTGSPFTLAAGASTRQSFAGINTGPVKLVSDVPIVAAQRIIYKVNNVETSYSETMGLPDSQVDTTFWLPWYNNTTLDTQLRFANVSSSTATVRVYIGGVEMTGSPFTLAAGASTRQSFAGINTGPVKIVSNVPIVAAERVIYTVNGVQTSYSETMGVPDSQLNTTFWFPMYNNVELDSQWRFANVSSSTATVRIYVGGVEMTGNCTPSNSPFTLAPGESLRVSCTGINNGPAKIVSDVPIVAAQRVIYTVNSVQTSYDEMMGLPDNQLDTIYWMPWYNNASLLTTELILGVGENVQPPPVTIDYEYDPLNRLTEANYSTGDYYHYGYDAVGNRLTQTTQLAVTSYQYDNANRLTSVNGVPYTWDDNGNLLNDSVNAYTYDSANRLNTFNGQGNNAVYSYNGLGDRLQEALNGNTTTFTMDLNSDLTQALSDGTNHYIYGMDRIAQVNTMTEYFLVDALGSVRQLTNNSGAVTYARAYDPYGTVTSSSGSSLSTYGYASEYTSNDMVYLRARYYTPDTARFLTRDTWSGDANRPLSLNQWMYAEGNPINYVDPSGNNIYSGICMGQVLFKPMPGVLLNMSAQRLVDLCKAFYSQEGFWQNYGVPGLGPYNCNELNNTPWNKPTTVNDLFGDYICERGETDHFYFNGNDVLTRKLARSLAVHNVRLNFYRNGNVPFHEEKFGGILQYLLEWHDLRVDSGFPIMHIMGSFKVSVMDTGSNRVNFRVENRTDLASGTHLIGRFPPKEQEEDPLSLEQFIANNSVLQNQSAASVLRDESIVSVLRPRDRDFTEAGMGGGNLNQTYTWTENKLQFCDVFLQWPFYLDRIDIGY